eukprot:TRINITY_DN63817_c0_g1_i1.p1 TRINITY_DN63817_c0_g1~~TRINITY_DN63817_c0_g1_i1.p1  ORF type:complete len:1120 (+),score=314.25 TRINITY_DN63817_c0_g1_i1:110-3469(+)
MEVILDHCEGIPQGALLSIKWGETKRQAAASKIGQPFRFSDAPSQPLPMKVEILKPVGDAKLVDIDPAKETFVVDLGENMKVRLRQREMKELQRPTVDIKSAAEGRGLPTGKMHLAQQAASYLEEHDLVRTFQDILHGLLISKPKDPHSFVEAHFNKARQVKGNSGGYGGPEPPVSDFGSNNSRKDSLASNPGKSNTHRRGSVRANMRTQQQAQQPNPASAKVDTLLMTLQAASDNLALVMPLLPAEFRATIESDELKAECEQHFRVLDKEDRGELTSDDLIDVIVYLTQGKQEAVTSEQCRKFTDMFDTDEDGLININEFINMVQFVSVAGFLETPEGQKLVQSAMVQEMEYQEFIRMIEADKERLWSIIPFLPQHVVDFVTSAEFQADCVKQFQDLDVDKSGSLEPKELIPVIQQISEARDMVITEEKCKQFTALFDSLGTGVIVQEEFIEFAQFLTVMNFLTNTVEGQGIAQQAGAITSEADKLRQRIMMLENEPAQMQSVLRDLPKPIMQEFTSSKFEKACREGFQAVLEGRGERSRQSIAPGALVPVIQQLLQGYTFIVPENQINYFTSCFDKDSKNSVTSDEFVSLARYVIVLGLLTYQLDNQEILVADALMGAQKTEEMLRYLKSGTEQVWELIPFLPQELVDELRSSEFEKDCLGKFKELDIDGSGALEPRELMPIIKDLSETHEQVLTDDHCRRFVDIFDVKRNGVINKDEFVQFVQFMMIMSYMETPEGMQQMQAAEESTSVSASIKSVEALLQELERDRHSAQKIIPLLPNDIYKQLTSKEFVAECKQQFKELDKDNSGNLEPSELFDVIVDLSSAHPYAVSLDQCERFTRIFDLRGDGKLHQDEFLDFVRFLCVMSYLHSEGGKAAAQEALAVLEDSKRIEDLIEAMTQNREAMHKVVPYLPQWLRTDLMSEKFALECDAFFGDLDKDRNGTLDAQELFPVVQSLCEASSMSLDADQCKRFANIFDLNGDGLISRDEFQDFATFMIMLSFLESQEGQLTLAISESDMAEQMNGSHLGGPQGKPPPSTPQDLDRDFEQDMPTPASPEHLAVDCEFYKNKSEKLTAENDKMRQRMNGLEDIVRNLQRQMEEQEQKLRHAQLDLRAAGRM